MNYSDYLNLKLPEQTDQYNVDDDNYNSNIIDNSIKNLDSVVQYVTFEIWQNTKTYSANKCVSKIISNELKLYQSLQNGNTGKDPETETTYWKDISCILKSGDTMTGTLEFDGTNALTRGTCAIYGQIPFAITGSSLPQNNVYALGKIVQDKSTTPKAFAREYYRYGTSGNNSFVRQLYNYNSQGEQVTNTITHALEPDGGAIFDFPKCETKPTTTSSAASNKVAVVTQNYVNDTSWYRVWSDGFIEQGGHIAVSSSSVTVNLLKSYSDAKYTVTTGNHQPAVGAGNCSIISISKNKFVLDCSGLGSLTVLWQTAGY